MEVAHGAVREDQRRAGIAPQQVGDRRRVRVDAAAGVQQHRHAVLVRDPHGALDARVVEAEPAAQRVQLDAARAEADRALQLGLVGRVGMRAGVRHQAAARQPCAASSTRSFASVKPARSSRAKVKTLVCSMPCASMRATSCCHVCDVPSASASEVRVHVPQPMAGGQQRGDDRLVRPADRRLAVGGALRELAQYRNR